MAIMANKLAWATMPWRQPDPRDGYAVWADAVVATASHFVLIIVNRHGFARVSMQTFDDVMDFLAASKAPESILIYAVNDAGQQVCISPQLAYFGEVWRRWHRPGGRA
jgi:hypothetical protein